MYLYARADCQATAITCIKFKLRPSRRAGDVVSHSRERGGRLRRSRLHANLFARRRSYSLFFVRNNTTPVESSSDSSFFPGISRLKRIPVCLAASPIRKYLSAPISRRIRAPWTTSV